MMISRRHVGLRPGLESLDARIVPAAVSPAELFIDKQLTADIAATIADFKTLVADVNGTTATQEQVALDELKVTRDLMIVQIDQMFDVQLDTTPTPTTTATPTTPATTTT